MKKHKIILAGSLILGSEVLWHLCRWFYRVWTNNHKLLKTIERETKNNISEVMFFTWESSICRTHAAIDIECTKDNCPVGHLRKLKEYINRSEKSLDLCMYIITCHTLSNAIVNAHKRGTRVRIIIDAGMVCNDAVQTALFHNNGIPIRLKTIESLMHHKFAIIDDSVLITGSTNWTMSAFFGNYDHILVTNQTELVRPFVMEFDKLWNMFATS